MSEVELKLSQGHFDFDVPASVTDCRLIITNIIGVNFRLKLCAYY